jgi:hypothetical protein
VSLAVLKCGKIFTRETTLKFKYRQIYRKLHDNKFDVVTPENEARTKINTNEINFEFYARNSMCVLFCPW